jgi:4'-phosphopantetheinyl transferase
MSMVLWGKPPNELFISRSELHVWKIDLTQFSKEYGNHMAILSELEQRNLNAFRFAKDRLRYAITHSMKRLIIANYLKTNPKTLAFTLGKHGKPAISRSCNWLNLHFNLSHSHHLIVIAITVSDVLGIDVEYHTKTLTIEALAEMVFSSCEKNTFNSLPSRSEKVKAFFRCWTRKEAYLKACGIGIQMDLKCISVAMGESPDKDWLSISPHMKMLANWKLFSFDIDEFYTAAIVSTAYPKKLVGYTVDPFTFN